MSPLHLWRSSGVNKGVRTALLVVLAVCAGGVGLGTAWFAARHLSEVPLTWTVRLDFRGATETVRGMSIQNRLSEQSWDLGRGGHVALSDDQGMQLVAPDGVLSRLGENKGLLSSISVGPKGDVGRLFYTQRDDYRSGLNSDVLLPGGASSDLQFEGLTATEGCGTGRVYPAFYQGVVGR